MVRGDGRHSIGNKYHGLRGQKEWVKGTEGIRGGDKRYGYRGQNAWVEGKEGKCGDWRGRRRG